MISAVQIRAGRALLGWSQAILADKASLSLPTIKRTESADSVSSETIGAIREALESGGVEFVEGVSPGVRLRVVDVWANPRAADGIWGVVAKWEIGAPVDWVAPVTAMEAADEAHRRGDVRLAGMLRKAATEADRNNRDAVRVRRR